VVAAAVTGLAAIINFRKRGMAAKTKEEAQ
jgi:hypothetical protein